MPAIKRPLASRSEGSAAYKEALGEYIKGCREAAGLTQAQLAKELDFQWPAAVSAIEVGRNGVPPERYLQFAIALKVEPREFGETVLKLSDPWMHALLFSADPKKATQRVNESIQSRLTPTKSLLQA